MEAMATLLYTGAESSETTGVTVGVGWWREAWSDRIDRSDRFKLQDGIGLGEVVHF